MAPVDNLGTGIRNALIPSESTKLKQYRNVLLGLSVSETVLGTLSIILGIAVSVLGSGSRYVSSYIPSSSYYDYSSYNNYYINYPGVGEGIWCGIWVLIAGSLGIAASRTKTKSCLIHCHMGFAITAAIFAASQVAASTLTLFNIGQSARWSLSIVSAIAGFISFVICIVSASYCCPLYTDFTGLSSCCGTGCCGDEVAVRQPVGQHLVYVQQPHNQTPYYPGVQPTQTIVQGPGGQQYVTTPYHVPGQPAMVMQQGMVMQNLQTTAMTQANPANPQPQAPVVYTNVAMQKEPESPAMQPPEYGN